MASRPTPYSIALSALIALHCDERSPLKEDYAKVDAFVQDCLAQNSREWSQRHAIPIARLLKNLQESVGSSVAETFQDWLQIASNTLDDLMDLVTTLQRAVCEGIVDATSASGMYMRSVSLGLEQLSFESTALLWKDFHHEMKNIQNQQEHVQQEWPLSPTQMEQALHGACVQHDDSQQQQSYEEMEVELQCVLSHNQELPSAHFLRFLNSARAGERVGALEALHYYFAISSPELLPFAAIVLAALHHASGDATLSLLATEEAVRVAQQSQDKACVAFALGWLFQNCNTMDAGELVRKCVQRAMEGNLRALSAGANLSLVQYSLRAGREPSVAAAAWAHWTAALTDAPTAESSSPLDPPTHMTHISSHMDALELLQDQRLMAAAIWDAFGQTQLSRLYSWNANNLQAIPNLARSCLFGSASVACAPDSNGSLHYDYLKSLDDGPDKKGTNDDCIYASALANLVELRELFLLPVNGVFLPEMALILHEWAVRRGDLNHAQALIVALESSLHPRIPNYTEVKLDVYTQKCLLLSRQGHWDQARELAKTLIEECKTRGLRTQHARLLLQLAMMELEAAAPQQQFTSALPSLFDCLTTTEKYGMSSLHAAALSILAQVHLLMRNPKRAMAVLQASLPSVLQQEHVWLQAEAYLTLAKCHLQRAKQEAIPETKPLIRKILQSALKELGRAEELFQKCQDSYRLREIYYLQARVYHSLPNSQKQRDEASQKFVQVSQYLVGADEPASDDFMSSLFSKQSLQQLLQRPITVGSY